MTTNAAPNLSPSKRAEEAISIFQGDGSVPVREQWQRAHGAGVGRLPSYADLFASGRFDLHEHSGLYPLSPRSALRLEVRSRRDRDPKSRTFQTQIKGDVGLDVASCPCGQ